MTAIAAAEGSVETGLIAPDESAGVSAEVREVLLGGPADEKACEQCGTARVVRQWPVEVTTGSDHVAYVGRCPACGRRDTHRIVDPVGRPW